MKVPSILEKFNVKPWKNASCLCFQLTRNVHFKWDICNFKFTFLSRGQLESLNLHRILLPLFKVLPCYEGFLVTYFLPLLPTYCAEIILNKLYLACQAILWSSSISCYSCVHKLYPKIILYNVWRCNVIVKWTLFPYRRKPNIGYIHPPPVKSLSPFSPTALAPSSSPKSSSSSIRSPVGKWIRSCLFHGLASPWKCKTLWWI